MASRLRKKARRSVMRYEWILDLLQLRYGDDDGDDLVGGYVVAHLKRDIVQLGEKVRRLLFSKCICFYWFLVFLKFWIFGILNTYFSTTISVISDLVLLSFELRILNFGFFKSHCQHLNFGFFLWSWALKTRLEGSVFFAGGVLWVKSHLSESNLSKKRPKKHVLTTNKYTNTSSHPFLNQMDTFGNWLRLSAKSLLSKTEK